MSNNKSEYLINKANQYIPGGVNSPVRAFKNVNGSPIYITKANGSKLYDADGNEYIDYVSAWGPSILGHNDKDINHAVKKAIDDGLVFGAPCEHEITLAEIICNSIPNIEKIRMTNSGTEATMSAIRLARGYTNKEMIIKFEGSYHGHSDSLLTKDNYQELNSTLELGGIPKSICKNTLIATYNDLESVKKLFTENSNNVAAIIVEPVAGNMNCVPPIDGFLQGLRDICNQYKSLLIFDEVMTGYRVAYSGSQKVYSVDADIITLGKIIGGGMPIGAFGGKKEIMDYISPIGPIYQGGTFCGHPITMVAGITALNKLNKEGNEIKLQELTKYLLNGLTNVANKYNIDFNTTQVGAMFGIFFNKNKITSLKEVNESNKTIFNKFHREMLKRGIYFAPSSFESCFMSLSHTYEDLDKTIKAADKVFSIL